MTGEGSSTSGWVEAQLRDEFPGLALRYTVLEGGAGRSDRDLRARLALLSDRFSGAQAINLRHQPIAWAYRVFFRHIGLDPDEQPTPVEALALERMRRGGFASGTRLEDALTVAIVESHVALRAFDADRIAGTPGIRLTATGEELAGRPGALAAGTLVIADDEGPCGLLFGATGADREVGRKTARTMLAAIQVKGVPDIAVEEALWLAEGIVRG